MTLDVDNSFSLYQVYLIFLALPLYKCTTQTSSNIKRHPCQWSVPRLEPMSNGTQCIHSAIQATLKPSIKEIWLRNVYFEVVNFKVQTKPSQGKSKSLMRTKQSRLQFFSEMLLTSASGDKKPFEKFLHLWLKIALKCILFLLSAHAHPHTHAPPPPPHTHTARTFEHKAHRGIQTNVYELSHAITPIFTNTCTNVHITHTHIYSLSLVFLKVRLYYYNQNNHFDE